jgi:hypothetical protein
MVKKTCIICKQETEKTANGMCPPCYMVEYRKTHEKKKYRGKCDNCGKMKDDIHNGLCQSCYKTKLNREKMVLAPLKKCECGDPKCEEMIPSITMQGKPRKYAENHGKRGKLNNFYKSGRREKEEYILLSGYKDHPNSNARGEILEHILVMTEHLNRPLFEGEIIHHKNKDKKDNRIENLELTDRSKHQNTHNPRKDYRKDMTGITCLECGSDTTYPSKNGQPHWCLHPITGQPYVCEKCYKRLKSKIQKEVSYNRKDLSGRRCVKCGVEKSVSSSGQSTWHGLGNGEYECKRCYDIGLREKKKQLKTLQAPTNNKEVI